MFGLHILLLMASLAISFTLMIYEINLGIDGTYVLLLIYFILALVFDKTLQKKITGFLKNLNS